SEFALRAGEATPLRIFGPTWFEVRDSYAGLSLTRTILCPEGEVPWVLIRVRLALSESAAAARHLRHIERWQLRPRFLNLLEQAAQGSTRAELAGGYTVPETATGLLAAGQFAAPPDPAPAGDAAKFLMGPPAMLALDRVAGTTGTPRFAGTPHPMLEI